ncbi:MAG: elongation factor P [Alphaproteobacteria bacterium]|nr:elongation factor P [Alphaproteobacteria bacterium]
MKINGNEVRPGYVLEHNGRLWLAVKVNHVKPGKGGAYAQVEMKDVRSGTKTNERFRSSEAVERVRLDQKDYQFLYANGDDCTFMDQKTYDQITLTKDQVGEAAVFLQDGMKVIIEFYEESPLSVQLPDSVVMTVVEADAVIKGQTAASSNKPAVLENGVRVMVPPFISVGEKIVVTTTDPTYVERAKA